MSGAQCLHVTCRAQIEKQMRQFGSQFDRLFSERVDVSIRRVWTCCVVKT